MAQTKVKEGLIDAALGGITWDSTAKTTNFTAAAGSGYLVDTSSSAITVTLPSSPSVGDEVTLVDYGANAATNNITITSSDDIEDSTSDVLIDYNKGSVVLFYSGATKGWLVKSAANETATALATTSLTVDYLVVAGGGAGGANRAGGGGAGGLRTSYGSTSGGGASAESQLLIDLGSDYTVTVGSGGSGSTDTNNPGANGSNSVFSTITSTGGGGGGSASSVNGSIGGSGGGAHRDGNGATATSSPVQGYSGGNGFSPTNLGGGGGGASEAGNTDGDGFGGDGLAVSITGSSVFYAGGGGAGGDENVGSAKPGGDGGGGAGAIGDDGSNGSDGTANTGGGGGGSTGGAGGAGGSGGSGVVIIRYPSSYTVTIGSGLTGSTATDGSDKVTTFTAGTGTISFS